MTRTVADDYLQNPALFHDKRILVAGDIALDRTFLCNPAPAGRHAVHAGEAILDVRPGGDDFGTIGAAYNACLLCAEVGAQSLLVTATGDDREGDRVAEVLAADGTEARHIRLPGIQTVTRLRFFVDDAGTGASRLLLRVDKDPDSALSHARVEAAICAPDFLQWWEQEAGRSDAVLFSDTDKGFLSRRVLVALNERTLRASARRVERGEKPLLVIVDPKRAWEKYIGLKVDVFKPNDTEAAGAVDLPRQDWSVDVNLEQLAGRVIEQHGKHFPRFVITLGEHGAAMVVAGDPGPRMLRYPGVPARTPAAGIAMHCGDMFASALALALCVDGDLASAIPFANYVASLQVSKPVGQKIRAADLRDPGNQDHLRSSFRPPRELA